MINYILNTPFGILGAIIFLVIFAILLLKLNSVILNKLD